MSWNPVRGCTRVSSGCKNCYAERLAGSRGMMMAEHGKPYENLVHLVGNEPRWTGRVRFIEAHLQDPIKKKPKRCENCDGGGLVDMYTGRPAAIGKPCFRCKGTGKHGERIFVNSMSDLFHEELDFSLIDEIAYVMQRANWHEYYVLTKRAARMAEWANQDEVHRSLVARNKHIIWGISAEDQVNFDARAPYLMMVPGRRMVSLEPLLGPITMRRYIPHLFSQKPPSRTVSGYVAYGVSRADCCEDCEQGRLELIHCPPQCQSPICWVIVGGESGPGARPMHDRWVRQIRDECMEAGDGVAFFFKQYGEWAPSDPGRATREKQAKAVHDWPDGTKSFRIGRQHAGHKLEGKEYLEVPGVGLS